MHTCSRQRHGFHIMLMAQLPGSSQQTLTSKGTGTHAGHVGMQSRAATLITQLQLWTITVIATWATSFVGLPGGGTSAAGRAQRDCSYQHNGHALTCLHSPVVCSSTATSRLRHSNCLSSTSSSGSSFTATGFPHSVPLHTCTARFPQNFRNVLQTGTLLMQLAALCAWSKSLAAA
jgi:hypothetical protein